nr:hypothetical protein [Finegoldia magna]
MCLTGSVVVSSLIFLASPTAWPFLMSCSYFVVLEPGTPSWSTTLLPFSRVSSSIISTSNGIGQVFLYS